MKHLQIDGTLVVPNDKGDMKIEAHSIRVKGNFKAGNSAVPFPNKLLIKINGEKGDGQIQIDSLERGNKLIAVTGLLSLYGKSPITDQTRLIATVTPGSTTMTVKASSDWEVGDELVIGPSFTNHDETEYVTITEKNSNSITFTPPLNYTHYGASNLTVYNGFGEIDARAAVGHLTRNIKIVSGGDTSWGYRILAYGYS